MAFANPGDHLQALQSNEGNEDSQDTLELSLKNYDFSSTTGLEVMIKALDKSGKLKVIKKMAQLPPDSLMDLLSRNQSVRQLLSAYHLAVLDSGIVSRQQLDRIVVKNPAMPSTSTKYWAICDYRPALIASFVFKFVEDLYGNNASKSKVLVVVDGEHFAQEVTAELNKAAYAVYVDEAPKNCFRSYLHQLQNWPVFLISSEIFSGNALGRMDAALVFKRRPDGGDLVSLEYQMAFNNCEVSAVVTPATDLGLYDLARAYNNLKFYLPMRI